MIKVTYTDRYHYTVRGLTSDQMGMLLSFLETAQTAEPELTSDARGLHRELSVATVEARPES